MTHNQFLTCWLVVLTLTQAVSAQDIDKVLRQQFAQLDPDKDGVLLRKEFPGSDRQYKTLDRDRNGKVTLEEYAESPVGRALVRSRYRAAREPRPRTTAAAVAASRLQWLKRIDKSRDGRVSRDEWTGTDAAFAQLDLDDNGYLDGRDRTEAAILATPTPVLPASNRAMPDIELLFKRFDKDDDQKLSLRELRTQKLLVEAMDYADLDDDGALDNRELQRLARAYAELRNPSSGTRPQPYDVPFASWDKDDDGKVRQNEWQGPRSLFDQMDLDRDAAVSKEEVARYRKRVTGDDFVERFDLDGDGKVTPAEFAGPLPAFRRADRNGDGVVTRSDR